MARLAGSLRSICLALQRQLFKAAAEGSAQWEPRVPEVRRVRLALASSVRLLGLPLGSAG